MLANAQAPQIDTHDSIVVALSGGVDSAVCALLLQQQGFDIQPLFMKNWEEDDSDGYCAASRDREDAERVCDALGVELLTVNLSSEYWENVFAPFLEEYKRCRTPNPDIWCNKAIKFDAFIEHAMRVGGAGIATGHYARISRDDDGLHLLKGVDAEKDQSYFLYTLSQPQLELAQFPLGRLAKPEVRRLAQAAGFENHAKKDSTGICFIGERPFREFLKRYIQPRPGDMETPEGHVVGSHQGLMYYTIGQRQGLGIGGRRGSDGEPWYVVDRDADRNVLVVVQGGEHPLLYSRSLRACDPHWVSDAPTALPFRCAAKTRYRQTDQACEIIANDDDGLWVNFDDAQRAVAPGQGVVFYRNEECLGGATIDAACRSMR